MSPGRGWRTSAGLLVLATLACTTVEPVQRPNRLAPPPEAFSHEAFDRVLARFVDDRGRVDYAGLARRPFELDRYLGQLAAWSPDSHPRLFPTEDDRLAYWINAYNAATLRLVLEHHPIGSVMDVRSPRMPPFLPAGAPFFFGHRFRLGGKATSLWALENRVVRRRFADPRFHFALNCASLGCPRLPPRAFVPEGLDGQLAAETARFLGEARNVRVDGAARTVWLSALFDWFREDFEAWQARRGAAPGVLGFVAEHAPEPVAADVSAAVAAGHGVRFVPWDWRLNDRAAGP